MNHQRYGEDEDEYGGFDDYNATLDTNDLENDPGFQNAVKTSYGRRPPPTAQRGLGNVGRAAPKVPPSSMGMRPITGAIQQDGGARPMTAVRGAGYTSAGRGPGFDPMGGAQGAKGPAPPLEEKTEDTPEEKIKQLEKRVNELIEESCTAASRADYKLALENAKEAGRKERFLVKQRENLAGERGATGGPEQINLDLTYSVLFNLANQYANNHMFNEALNTYSVIVKNKMFSNAGRLKVNMGNIHFQQRNYSKAIKMYHMALDQVPSTHRAIRIKIMQNIGIAFVKLGQYNDAIVTFERIQEEEPNFTTGFNLILCFFAMGDKQRMKRTFQQLLTVDLKSDDDDRYFAATEDPQHQLVLEVIRNDALRKYEREKKTEAERCIMMSAKIIAPAIEDTFAMGYEWCMDQVKQSQYMDLIHNLEIDKALAYLREKDFQQAVETLKSFEKKDSRVATTAAVNLSFLYNLEGDPSNADKYAEVALQADRYNPSALVNKGNVLLAKGDYEKAREFYREALQNDSSCIEALYNLGLCNKALQRYQDALDSFYKLHNILKTNASVMYQLGDISDRLGESSQAMEWFHQLKALNPSDAALLRRLAHMYEAEGDHNQAFHLHTESFTYDPCDLEEIEWLGSYYLESQFPERAVAYFERAALVQPGEIKWQLMVASCYRKAGNYPMAFEKYKSIHRRFPDNIDCLKFLVRLCTDQGLKEAQEYANKLKKAEKVHQAREERASSGRASASRRRQLAADAEQQQRQTSAGRSRRGENMLGAGPLQSQPPQPVETSYKDPLGPQMERPKTAARKKEELVDEFADEELGDDLLPE